MAAAIIHTRLRPGYHPSRMIRIIREAIGRCRLDLSDKVVLTEAATGAYVVTPVIAALAGASKVYAVAKSSPYGSCAEVIRQTRQLAELAGRQDRIQIVTRPTSSILSEADIITNSGHVRPLDAQKISHMKPTAVISLMYEAWELRPSDVDIDACRRRGIRVVATNEQHPQIDVFGYLGVLAMKQLMDAGVSGYKSRILLLSDNDFAPYIRQTLTRAGAHVQVVPDLMRADPMADLDAILLAMRPRSSLNLPASAIRWMARRWPGAMLVQFFGDVDRMACHRYGVPVWPLDAPAKGHMGILPAEIGPEATIRLQTGGLKAAEISSGRQRNQIAQRLK